MRKCFYLLNKYLELCNQFDNEYKAQKLHFINSKFLLLFLNVSVIAFTNILSLNHIILFVTLLSNERPVRGSLNEYEAPNVLNIKYMQCSVCTSRFVKVKKLSAFGG